MCSYGINHAILLFINVQRKAAMKMYYNHPSSYFKSQTNQPSSTGAGGAKTTEGTLASIHWGSVSGDEISGSFESLIRLIGE
jgi:hypothetical protein